MVFRSSAKISFFQGKYISQLIRSNYKTIYDYLRRMDWILRSAKKDSQVAKLDHASIYGLERIHVIFITQVADLIMWRCTEIIFDLCSHSREVQTSHSQFSICANTLPNFLQDFMVPRALKS